MINDIKLGFRVIKYGLSFKASIIGIILFVILGCGVEILMPDMPIGGLYIAMGGIFAAQLIHSVCVSTMVQSSPNKKKLQTIVPTYVTLIIYLVMNTLQLTIKILVYNELEKTEAQLSNAILLGAIMMTIISLYVGGSFKAFWPATILFFIVFMIAYPISMAFVFDTTIYGDSVQIFLPLWVSVLLSYLIIIIDCGLMYLMFLGLYKKDYSKITFQAALKRAR